MVTMKKPGMHSRWIHTGFMKFPKSNSVLPCLSDNQFLDVFIGFYKIKATVKFIDIN
jgi:hypothetical protein